MEDPLLKLLEEHALRTPDQLGKMLNCPAEEVKRRIKQYEDDKIILGYKAIINDDKLDTEIVKAVIEVRIQPEREGGFDRVAKRIAKFNEVTSLFLMSGGYDLLIFVEGRSIFDRFRNLWKLGKRCKPNRQVREKRLHVAKFAAVRSGDQQRRFVSHGVF